MSRDNFMCMLGHKKRKKIQSEYLVELNKNQVIHLEWIFQYFYFKEILTRTGTQVKKWKGGKIVH